MLQFAVKIEESLNLHWFFENDGIYKFQFSGDLFGITANIDLMNKILGKWHHTSLDKGLKKMIDSLV